MKLAQSEHCRTSLRVCPPHDFVNINRSTIVDRLVSPLCVFIYKKPGWGRNCRYFRACGPEIRCGVPYCLLELRLRSTKGLYQTIFVWNAVNKMFNGAYEGVDKPHHLPNSLRGWGIRKSREFTSRTLQQLVEFLLKFGKPIETFQLIIQIQFSVLCTCRLDIKSDRACPRCRVRFSVPKRCWYTQSRLAQGSSVAKKSTSLCRACS